MAIPTGRQGRTKAVKRADRLKGMEHNRKRDKRSWRSRYHSEFKNAPGPIAIQSWEHGFVGRPAGAKSQNTTKHARG